MFNSSASSFFKGMTAGLVIGTGVTMLSNPLSDKQRRKLMRKTEGVFKSIGGMIDDAVGMFR
ncbi:MAG: hypothetical protein IJH37_11295 [Clostridia bacterium]|nr:hypothetical protein [Clostridia bacterium]